MALGADQEEQGRLRIWGGDAAIGVDWSVQLVIGTVLRGGGGLGGT